MCWSTVEVLTVTDDATWDMHNAENWNQEVFEGFRSDFKGNLDSLFQSYVNIWHDLARTTCFICY